MTGITKILLLLHFLLPVVITAQETAIEYILEYQGKQPLQSFLHAKCESRNLSSSELISVRPLLPVTGNEYYMVEIRSSFQNQWKDIFNRNGEISKWEQNTPVEWRNKRPNDPRLNSQWYLENIKAFDAWMITTGGLNAEDKEVVIAVIDDGFQVNHEDFENIFFINQGEIPDDFKDNDGNGLIDDVMGYDFLLNSGTLNNARHGTNVVGVLGARGDNQIGIAGINWNVKVLPIAVPPTSTGVVQGLNYALKMKELYNSSNGALGANIVVTTYSAGIKMAFGTSYPVWCDMYDKLGQVGIISIGATTNDNDDVDAVGDVPSTCTSNFLLMLTNSDSQDVKAREAGYGSESIDLAAPGEDILTTNNSASKYGYENGTSLSAPITAGAVSLLMSVDCEAFQEYYKSAPALAILELKDILMTSGDNAFYLKAGQRFPLSEVTVSGKRLNIFKALDTLRTRFGDCIPDFNSSGSLEISEIRLVDNLAFVTYKTSDPGDIEYILFDGTGRKILQSIFTPPTKGSKILTLDLSPALGAGNNISASQVYMLGFFQGKSKAGTKFYYFNGQK